MFLQKSELAFVDALKAVGVPVEEFDFPKKKLINVQTQIEKFVSKEFELHVLAKDAFRLVLPDSILPHSPAPTQSTVRGFHDENFWSVLLIADRTE